MKDFYFYQNDIQLNSDSDTIVLEIPKNLSDEDEICKVYARGLNFPDYFGMNWDALADCLRDLEFLKEQNVVIVHKDIPFKENREQAFIYLRILYHVILHWAELDLRKLYVYFPAPLKTEVYDILNF